MNIYEINLLITPSFSQDKLNEFNEKLIEEFKDFGEKTGEITTVQKKLAYLIEKEKEAWLVYFNFSLKAETKKEALDEIEKNLKEKTEILRYLILDKKEAKVKVKKVRPSRKVLQTEVLPEKKKEVTKTNLEKVDEKVEELLKDES